MFLLVKLAKINARHDHITTRVGNRVHEEPGGLLTNIDRIFASVERELYFAPLLVPRLEGPLRHLQVTRTHEALVHLDDVPPRHRHGPPEVVSVADGLLRDAARFYFGRLQQMLQCLDSREVPCRGVWKDGFYNLQVVERYQRGHRMRR